MNRPTLTVAMPNYNHAKYLPESLEAILDQSYRPFEIIVLDDATTDDSVNIIESYVKREPSIRFIKSEINRGVTYQLNYLLKIAVGDYFCAPAADDKMLPGFLEKSMNSLAQFPQAGLCSTRTQCIDGEGRERGILHTCAVTNRGPFISSEKALSIMHRHGSWMQGNTVIFRRQALMDSGGLIPELHSFWDGFIHTVIAAKYGVCFIAEPLAAWRQVENSYSANLCKDPERPLQIIRHAKELMSTTYRDLFSS